MFLKDFYQGRCIAANDIGTVNYISDIRCLDLAGLASLEVVIKIRNNRYNTREIYNMAKNRNVIVSIVYDDCYETYGGLPSEWIQVSEWEIHNNVVCADDTVSFYVVDPEKESELVENLKLFSSHLPKDVIQIGKYTNTKER